MALNTSRLGTACPHSDKPFSHTAYIRKRGKIGILACYPAKTVASISDTKELFNENRANLCKPALLVESDCMKFTLCYPDVQISEYDHFCVTLRVLDVHVSNDDNLLV